MLDGTGYLDGSGEKADMTMTDYRKRAEECLEIAQTARTPAQRTMLLHIAETWMISPGMRSTILSSRTDEGPRQTSSLN